MRPSVPKKLQAKGRKMWRAVTGAYELRPDELRILEDACREVDLIERLQDAIEDAPLTVSGSMGQQVANPLVQELRQHRGVLARLLQALKLSDLEAGKDSATAAREAAISRWGRR